MKVWDVFWVFLRLGLTSFGGPIAHLGYFHEAFVVRRKWLQEAAYADLVALCQFLPGPASSQVGMALGFSRAGYLGALAAWLGFTLPSALLMMLFALSVAEFSDYLPAGALHGLKVVAVAVVAQAIWGLGIKLCPDRKRLSLAVAASLWISLWPTAGAQIAIVIAGGLFGLFALRTQNPLPHTPIQVPTSRAMGLVFLSAFFALLVGLPWLAKTTGNPALRQLDSYYRVGSLVFGGGHVVLPLLKNEVVGPGWVSQSDFVAGYGAAQGIPGPLLSLSAYLGAVASVPPSGLWGGLLCLGAIFLPSFLLILGVLPFWENLRQHQSMRFAMSGINAAVVGLLISAFYHPVWTSAILNARDFSLGLAAFALLAFWKTPSWLVVLLCAGIGAVVF